MSLLNLLPYRVRVPMQMRAHDKACLPVLQSPPIRAQQDGLVIFSMIGTKVLLPYLVAVKSLWGQLQRGRIILLDDGTLTDADKTMLAHHCDHPEIIAIKDVDMQGFPTGGCWERLLSILDRRAGDYVIQLDSDTVTIGAIDDVRQAIEAGRSFTLGGDPESADRGVMTVADYVTNHVPSPAEEDDHIQIVLERNMAALDGADRLHYIRGCAGFAGFAPSADARTKARRFVDQYGALLGAEMLAKWGSEQFMSNLLIANEPQTAVVLPGQRYINYWGTPWAPDTGFVHFIGTHRYSHGAYVAATRHALAKT